MTRSTERLTFIRKGLNSSVLWTPCLLHQCPHQRLTLAVKHREYKKTGNCKTRIVCYTGRHSSVVVHRQEETFCLIAFLEIWCYHSGDDFVGTKLNRICCSNKHFFFDLLRSSSSSALSAQSNLEAEVELAPRSPNSCVLQLSITRSSHELTVNPNEMIDLAGGEVRTLFLLVPQFYGRKSQSLERALITFLRLNQRQT